MAIEALGKPTTTLVYQYFLNDAHSTASSRGMPNLRVIPEPIISECTVKEEIENGVAGGFDHRLRRVRAVFQGGRPVGGP